MNCDAYRNHDFTSENKKGGIDMINNTAYLNGTNFNLLGLNAEPTAACELAANSFDMKLRLSDRDFHSLDLAGLTAPRQPDGSLPSVPFMKLKAGNDAIDKGVSVGLPFTGKAPDLGAFEYGER